MRMHHRASRLYKFKQLDFNLGAMYGCLVLYVLPVSLHFRYNTLPS
jgi:hypothetical protein